ncbi:DUF3954 domain-containing protein [Fictibacillus sp. 7GRE50]|uniref:DUF3954 domain-containing protein n=1 Tax=Fictibacillus sp. 7GRE50 TaxID=2745878 RepID=UPI001E32B734|nr:DUF3954 domain-containing protein [Fictibacillus sp. 7GRE50]
MKTQVMNAENIMTAAVDLMHNATYVVRDGVLKQVPQPVDGYGKQIITWENGKPLGGKLESSFKIK